MSFLRPNARVRLLLLRSMRLTESIFEINREIVDIKPPLIIQKILSAIESLIEFLLKLLITKEAIKSQESQARITITR